VEEPIRQRCALNTRFYKHLDRMPPVVSTWNTPCYPMQRLARAEFNVGDYQRVFELSEQVDQTKIKATMKNGVLRLTLPKAEAARTQKIAVTTE
jgi:hypothetical protein